MDEKNYNLNTEFCKSIIRNFKRYHFAIKRGMIYFTDKYDNETNFSQIYSDDIKEKVNELKQQEYK